MLFRRKKQDTRRAGIVVADNPTSVVSEQYRTIRTNIQFSMIDGGLETLLITSATPSSGKTTTATNLAAAFASEGIRVLVVATDMRKPTMHKIFNVQNTRGLTTLLLDSSLEVKDVARRSYVNNLYYINSGPIPPNPAELINSNRMNNLIEEMKAEFDLVIFDSPPLLAVTDAQILATKVDGTIIVIPQGEVTKDELDDAADMLKNVKANVLGTVMNKIDIESDSYYYYNYTEE
jgi:capsular exopolysaccharide synthesis family protein